VVPLIVPLPATAPILAGFASAPTRTNPLVSYWTILYTDPEAVIAVLEDKSPEAWVTQLLRVPLQSEIGTTPLATVVLAAMIEEAVTTNVQSAAVPVPVVTKASPGCTG